MPRLFTSLHKPALLWSTADAENTEEVSNSPVASIRLRKRTVLIVSVGALAFSVLANRLDSLLTGTLPAISLARAVPSACPPDADDEHFNDGRDHWWKGYEIITRAMNEPALACGASAADETYRFIWTHAFTHFSPFAVRIARKGQRYTLVAVVLEWDPRSQSDPLKVRMRRERVLTDAEWHAWLSTVETMSFWTTPGALNEAGFEGSTWVLEGRKGAGYHVVRRWSPGDGAFRDAALSLNRLGELPVPEAE